MKKLTLVCLVSLLVLTSCSSSKEKNIIEYGSTFDLGKYLELKEGETTDISLQVDTATTGNYILNGNVKKGDKVTKKISKRVRVEDTNKPKIKTLQDTNTTYEIPFNDTYQIIGNIDKITDKIDGEYNGIQIVNGEEYKKIKDSIQQEKEKASKQEFKTKEDLNAYKESKVMNGYTVLTSNVNTAVAGKYKIQIATIDRSFNTTEVSYTVKVLEEGKKVSNKKLAAGATGSKMGKAMAYQITDKTKPESPVEAIDETPQTNATSNEQEVQTFNDNIVSGNAVSSQGSPVLQSALNLVGSPMMCDSLVTMALVNGGMITGSPASIFVDGPYYNIGVYQFPAVGQFISASQAIPGDLVFYDNGGYGSSHIAVYAGNGKAVHGGWNGMNVVVSTVDIGSGPRYMRFPAMSWSDIYVKIFGQPQGEINNGGNTGGNSAPSDNGTTNPGFEDDFDWGEIGGDSSGGAYYRSMCTVDSVTIAVGFTSPIDEAYLREQVSSCANGEITYDQMVANLTSRGYDIVDPF